MRRSPRLYSPGGTTHNDINIKAVLRLKADLELNAFGQAEFWEVPALASGQQHDFTGLIQLTYFPKLSRQLHQNKTPERDGLRSGDDV